MQPFCVLLIQCEAAPRKLLRAALDRAGARVVAVDSHAEAAVRLRWRDYDLVVFTGRGGYMPFAEDVDMLVDRGGPMKREADWLLHAPRTGLRAAAILVVASIDPTRVVSAMEAVRSRIPEPETSSEPS